MLDGHVLIDAHVHVPVLGSLRPAWIQWARDFGPPLLRTDKQDRVITEAGLAKLG